VFLGHKEKEKGVQRKVRKMRGGARSKGSSSRKACYRRDDEEREGHGIEASGHDPAGLNWEKTKKKKKK